MSFANALKLVDKKLGDLFHAPEFNLQAEREKLVQRLDKQKGKFLKTDNSRVTKEWEVNNNIVEFKPTLASGQPLLLDGEPKHFVPAERFPDYVDAIIAGVKAGEADDQLKASGGGAKGGKAPKVAGEKKTRVMGEQSRVNIQIGGYRRGGQDDDAIRARLEADGVSKEIIDAGLARKKK